MGEPDSDECVRGEAALRAVLAHTDAQLVLLDREFNVVLANPAAARADGETVGRSWFQVFPDPDLERVFRRVRDTGRVWKARARPHRPRRGRVTWWNWTVAPVPGEGSEVQGLLITRQEVTPLVAARRRALRMAREMGTLQQVADRRAAELDAVLDSMADGVILHGPALEATRMNDAARALLGADVEDLPAGWPERMDLLGPDLQAIPVDRMPAVRAIRGEVVRGELVGLESRSGRRRWVQMGAAPVRGPGGHAGCVVSFTDVTRLKDLQERQETILHVVSHDLRSPLAGVRAHVELLEDACRCGAAASESPFLLEAVDRMDAMVEDLLDVASVEGGVVVLNLQEVHLEEFLQALRDGCEPDCQDRIRLHVDPGSPPVQADPGRLERIVLNLLSNALKYAPGPVDLVVTPQSPDRVALEVADRGPGIPEPDVPALFQRFSRAGAGRGTRGLGLGLYIVRTLAEAQGGSVEYAPRPGGGSTFRLVLPRGG